MWDSFGNVQPGDLFELDISDWGAFGLCYAPTSVPVYDIHRGDLGIQLVEYYGIVKYSRVFYFISLDMYADVPDYRLTKVG